MPAGRIDQSMYLGPFRSVERINVTTLYKPGELGSQIQLPNGKGYQLVQVDSGATASTGAAHAPQCGDLAFWKNKSAYLVTNDRVQAQSGVTNSRNLVAGVFCSITEGAAGTASITPGNYGVIQQRGQHVGVLTSAATLAAGLIICASSSSTVPDGVNIAVGSSPVGSVVGIATAANGAVTATYTPATLGGVDIVDTP
jgi:hypothetical protein